MRKIQKIHMKQIKNNRLYIYFFYIEIYILWRRFWLSSLVVFVCWLVGFVCSLVLEFIGGPVVQVKGMDGVAEGLWIPCLGLILNSLDICIYRIITYSNIFTECMVGWNFFFCYSSVCFSVCQTFFFFFFFLVIVCCPGWLQRQLIFFYHILLFSFKVYYMWCSERLRFR